MSYALTRRNYPNTPISMVRGAARYTRSLLRSTQGQRAIAKALYMGGKGALKLYNKKKKNKKVDTASSLRQEEDETQLNPGSVWTDGYVNLKMAGKKSQSPPTKKKDMGSWIYNHQLNGLLNSGFTKGGIEFLSIPPIMTAGQMFTATGITTASNIGGEAWAQSLWGLDPNANTTATATTAQGGIGVAALTLGNTNSSLAISGSVYIKEVKGEYIFTNFGNASVEIFLRWVTPKIPVVDYPEDTADTAADQVRMGAGTNLQETTTTAGRPGAVDITLPAPVGRPATSQFPYGITPTMFKAFNDNYKVLRYSSHVLQPGNSKVIKFRIKYNCYMDCQKMYQKCMGPGSSGFKPYLPGYTVFCMVGTKGAPGWVLDGVDANDGQGTLGLSDVRYVGYYNVVGKHVADSPAKIPNTVRSDAQLLSNGNVQIASSTGTNYTSAVQAV